MLDLHRIASKRHPRWFSGRRAPLARGIVEGISRLLRVPQANAFLREHGHLRGLAFVEAALEHLDARVLVDHVERERIPQHGRVLIVANHALGAIDALALLQFVGSIRRDVRIVANEVLGALGGLRDVLLPLRVFGGAAAADSVRAIDEALAREEAVIVFPAGEVSRLTPRGVRDGEWRRGFLRFASRAGAPIVPVHVGGRNSALFYAASALFKPLGTALLPREAFARRVQRVTLRVGLPWRSGELPREPAHAIARLRRELYALPRAVPTRHAVAPVAHARDAPAIVAEAERMDLLGRTPDGKEIRSGRLRNDSALLRELARLREETFRAVGEGTGRRLDTDRFDDWYDQIVLWDPAGREIVGGYRVAPCARVLGERGVAGLYSASLFRFDGRVLPVLERGMELGRSFVVPKYWGTRSLEYLWCGIGAYLRRHPQIRYLFGPVSLSAALPDAARDWLVAYYSRFFGDTRALALSNHPFHFASAAPDFDGCDAEAGMALLRDRLTALGARVPTLFKQYTELCEPGGASFLAFGVDPQFAGSVDGLILVDLARVKARKRERYLDARPARALDAAA